MDLRRALKAHGDRRKKSAIMTMCFKPVTRQLREDRLGESNLVVVTDPAIDRVLHYEAHAAPSDFPFSPSARAPVCHAATRARRARRLAIFRPRQRARAHGRARLPRGHLRARGAVPVHGQLRLPEHPGDFVVGRSTTSAGTTSTRTSWSSASTPSAWTRCARTTLFLEMSSDAGRHPMTPDANALPRGERQSVEAACGREGVRGGKTCRQKADCRPGTVLGEGARSGNVLR